MPDFQFLKDVTAGIETILRESFSQSGLNVEIVTKPPPDAGPNADQKLSLWLYHLHENEFNKNDPMQSQHDGSRARAKRRFPALALNLFYLVTPLANDAAQGQLLLGKVLQSLHDHSIATIEAADGSLHEMRILLAKMTLEELTRVWDALRQPYRLSVTYEVRVARIESTREIEPARIVERFGD